MAAPPPWMGSSMSYINNWSLEASKSLCFLRVWLVCCRYGARLLRPAACFVLYNATAHRTCYECMTEDKLNARQCWLTGFSTKRNVASPIEFWPFDAWTLRMEPSKFIQRLFDQSRWCVFIIVHSHKWLVDSSLFIGARFVIWPLVKRLAQRVSGLQYIMCLGFTDIHDHIRLFNFS